MVSASFVLLLIFAALGPLDGHYLHLWRYRLHARAESRREHALHTARALLFPVILVLLYGGSSAGWPLVLGAVLVAADVAVLIAGLHLYLWLRPTSLIEEGARP